MAAKITRKTTQVIHEWSGHRVSNPGPRPWQGRALPTELCPRIWFSQSIQNRVRRHSKFLKNHSASLCLAWCTARSLHNTDLFLGNKKARRFWQPGFACGKQHAFTTCPRFCHQSRHCLHTQRPVQKMYSALLKSTLLTMPDAQKRAHAVCVGFAVSTCACSWFAQNVDENSMSWTVNYFYP